MSDTNGTVAAENRVEEVVVKEGKSGKKKQKQSRFSTLFNVARRNTSGKGKLNGMVYTDEGEVSVTLNCFPESLTDEGYQEAALATSLSLSFDLEGRKLSGIHCKNATEKLKADAAIEFLESVMDTDEEE